MCTGIRIAVPPPIEGVTIQKALSQCFGRNQLVEVMVWISKSGSFWDDQREHSRGEYLECRDELVTDSAVGEAATLLIHGARSVVRGLPKKTMRSVCGCGSW